MKLAWLYAAVLMLIGTVLFETAPGFILSLFSASESMLAIGIPALRIIGAHFVPAAFCIVTISTISALGKSVYSLIISFCRQLLVLLPAGYLLGRIGGLHAVWWSYIVAECASVLTSAICLRRVNRTLICTIPDRG